MPEAVIVDAVRTPIGRAFKGALAGLRPDDTGAYVIDQLLERNPDVSPESVEEVIAGCGLPQGLQAFNIGRIMVLLSEQLPDSVNGVTVSRYCASSLEAIRQAANAVRAGEGDTYIAAGVEWVSRYNERQEAAGVADQNEKLQGNNGQPNAYIAMGLTAENVADKWEVSRADMDKYAQRSQELAVASQESGFFDREIVPVTLPDGTEVAQGRGPARELHAGEAGRAEARLPRGRQGDGRQLVPAERRRRGRAGHVGHAREGARPEAARAHRRLGHGGARAGDHGRRPDRRDQEGARARRHDDRRRRRGRAERGVRRPGDPDHERVRHPAREAEPARRGDRARPPVRHDRARAS